MPAHTDIMGRRYRPDIINSSRQRVSSCCPGHLQRPACRGPKRGGATLYDPGLRPVCPSGPGQDRKKVDGGLPVQGRESRSQRSGALLHGAGRPCGGRRFLLPLPGQDNAPARQGTITDNEKGGRDPALIVVLPQTIGSTAHLRCPYV